jgi:hypothetical protein
MGIGLTVVVIIALLVVARAVLRGYESEARKNPDSSGAEDPFEPMLFPPNGTGSTVTSDSHTVHTSDTGCGDTHHLGCDPEIQGGFDGGHGGFGGHH